MKHIPAPITESDIEAGMPRFVYEEGSESFGEFRTIFCVCCGTGICGHTGKPVCTRCQHGNNGVPAFQNANYIMRGLLTTNEFLRLAKQGAYLYAQQRITKS